MLLLLGRWLYISPIFPVRNKEMNREEREGRQEKTRF